MFKTDTPKDGSLFVLNHIQFLILFLTLFGLLFVYAGSEFSAEIYIAYQRKFVIPQMEKKFGFRGKRQKVVIKGTDYTEFVIDSVEPGSLFEQAGIKPGDMPLFYECRFFWINKTDESRFYVLLSSLGNDRVEVFNMVNIDDYINYQNGKGFYNKRRVFLTTTFEPCEPPQ